MCVYVCVSVRDRDGEVLYTSLLLRRRRAEIPSAPFLDQCAFPPAAALKRDRFSLSEVKEPPSLHATDLHLLYICSADAEHSAGVAART